MMHRQNNVEAAVLKVLQDCDAAGNGMHICVCFSGGMDSAVLLHILCSLQSELGIRLSACHFNHQIRGKDADDDEAFCRRVAAKAHVPFFCGREDVPALQRASGRSLEETARDARYAWFSSLAQTEQIDRFVTAHHLNDQAETVLFRLIRGTTTDGLCGIPLQRDRFLRPLLQISREQIQAYAQEHEIAYRHDETNDLQQYSRNYIRHTMLPMLEKLNPSVLDSLLRLSEAAAEDRSFFASVLPSYEPEQQVGGMPDALLRRVLSRNFHIFCGESLCTKHIARIREAVRSGEDVTLSLPNGKFARVRQGALSFFASSSLGELPLEAGVLQAGSTLLCDGTVRISYAPDGSEQLKEACVQNVYNLSTEFPLSCRGIYGMIRYRKRMPGDRLCLHGVNRSVKKLISEHKLPHDLRERLPILYDDAGILCVPFVALADRVFAKDDARDDVCRIRVDCITEAMKGG